MDTRLGYLGSAIALIITIAFLDGWLMLICLIGIFCFIAAWIYHGKTSLKKQHVKRKPKSTEKLQTKPLAKVNLPTEPTKILQLFATHEEITIGYLMGLTFLDPVKIEYWLEDLESKKFIGHRAYYDDTASEYFLEQTGRKYLIENDLLQTKFQ